MAELKEDERDLKCVDIWNIKVNLLGKEDIIDTLNRWISKGEKGKVRAHFSALPKPTA